MKACSKQVPNKAPVDGNVFTMLVGELSLREKCPFWEFFWSVFSHIRTEYGPIAGKYEKNPSNMDTFHAVLIVFESQ